VFAVLPGQPGSFSFAHWVFGGDEDGNVGVAVFPQHEQLLIRGAVARTVSMRRGARVTQEYDLGFGVTTWDYLSRAQNRNYDPTIFSGIGQRLQPCRRCMRTTVWQIIDVLPCLPVPDL
jgi:hypothetical protein